MNEDEDRLDRRLARTPSPEVVGACVDDGELLAYQRGALAADRIEALERHLAGCGACRTLLRELSQPVSPELRRDADAALLRQAAGRRPRFWLPVAGLALAAAVALFVLRPPPPSPPLLYELEGPLGGIKASRGEGPGSADFAPSGRIRFLLRPARGGTGRVELHVLRIDAGERLVDVTGDDWTVTEEGGVRWEAPVEHIAPGPGPTRLAVVLSPSGPRQDYAKHDLPAAQAADPNATWWFREIQILPEPQKEETP